MPISLRLATAFLASVVALTHLFLMGTRAAGQGIVGGSKQVQQDKSKSDTAVGKPKTKAASGQSAQPAAPAYIQDIMLLNPPTQQLSVSPDAKEIVGLMGHPEPFSLTARGSSAVVIYCSKRKAKLTEDETALLKEIETNIHELAANQAQAIEIPVAHASAIGDLVKEIASLNYDDIKVEAVGPDKVRAICDARVSTARFQSFVRDVQHLASQPKPDSPVARVFFVNAPDAAGVLGGSDSGGKTKKSSGSSTTSPKVPSVETPKRPSGESSAETSSGTPAKTADTTKDSSADKKLGGKGSDETSAESSPTEEEADSGTKASGGGLKPSANDQASSTLSVKSLNNDLLVFFKDHPGNDADVTERKRILAAVDFPRPEVIINTFSFQTSSTDPDVLYQTTDRVRRQMGLYNDGLQVGIARAWQYLEGQIAGNQFFDKDFYSYLTKYYVADSQAQATTDEQSTAASVTGSDLSKATLSKPTEKRDDLSKIPVSERLATLSGDRNKFNICDAGKYCLGYTSLFHPLRPSLTDMLIAVIASNTPGTHIRAAIDAMEGKEKGEFSHVLTCPSPKKPGHKQSCKMPQFRTCEEQDEYQLEIQDFSSQTFIFPMNCFRNAATEVFLDEGDKPSLVKPLRAAVANFLFHYKMSQQYPHEFSPYDLSESAQELNSELNPLVSAFNRDLAAALRPLENAADPRETKGNGWFGFSGHGSYVRCGKPATKVIEWRQQDGDIEHSALCDEHAVEQQRFWSEMDWDTGVEVSDIEDWKLGVCYGGVTATRVGSRYRDAAA